MSSPLSDEILLYFILFLMFSIALGAILPALLRIGREAPSVEREDEAYGVAVTEALRRQWEQLEADHEAGIVTDEQYRTFADDLRRRTLEEHDAVFNDPNDGRGRQAASFSGPIVIAAVVSLMTAVSGGFYALNGAPELMALKKAQAVYDGRADTAAIVRYLEGNASDGRAWVLLARRYVDEGKFPEAADAYRKGRKANNKVKEDPEVMLEMVATLLTIGGDADYREAEPLAERALQKLPGDTRALELLTMAASANQKWRKAADALAELLAVMPPDRPEYMSYELTLQGLRARADAAEGKK